MRLTCPNCAAEYEVPEAAIPAEGRDLQCSNCGHTWFFDPYGAPEGQEPMARPKPPEPPHAIAPRSSKTEREVPPLPPVERKKPVDPEVAAVLQEEAAREVAARAEEGRAGLEFQGDLGLEDPEVRRGLSSDRLDDPEADEPDASLAPAPKRTSGRSDAFPDIEEINSTLTATSAKAAAQGKDEAAKADRKARRRRGFRWGFAIALILLTIALLVYVYPTSFSEELPGLRNQIADYVAWLDRMRLWLDGKIAQLLAYLRTTAEAGVQGDGAASN